MRENLQLEAKRMREKGQLQLEAIICFAAFLAVLGLFLGSINEAGEEANHAVQALKAKAESEKCCIVVDAAYAGGLAEFSQKEMHCTAEGNLVQSIVGEKSAASKCIAEEIRLVKIGEKSVLEVKQSEHYR